MSRTTIFEPSRTQIETLKTLAQEVHHGERVFLVGAGVSIPSGIPDWKTLIDRVRARVSPEISLDLLYAAFKNDVLAVASFLRARSKPREWSKIIYDSLYAELSGEQRLLPSQAHRLIIAMTNRPGAEIWTTNYDNLLEIAFEDANNGSIVESRDPLMRRADLHRQLRVNHLHGYLPFTAGNNASRTVEGKPVISIDDYLSYHTNPSNPTGWTQSEFLTLFDHHSVLLVGLSLIDPNLRNAVHQTTKKNGPSHHAIFPTDSKSAKGRIVSQHWRHYGIRQFTIPDRQHVVTTLSLLHMLIDEEILFRESANAALEIRHSSKYRNAFLTLFMIMRQRLTTELVQVVDIGLFLLDQLKSESPRTISKVLSVKNPSAYLSGSGRRFNVELDQFQGAAGVCFVSCDVIAASVFDHRYDFRMSKQSQPSNYNYVICVPLVDWQRGGLRLGTLYATIQHKQDVTSQTPYPSAAVNAPHHHAQTSAQEQIQSELERISDSLLHAWDIVRQVAR